MSNPNRPIGVFHRLLNGALAILAAIWLILEEWLWDGMVALMARIGRLPVVHWLEARVRALPPYAAMIVFLIPALVLLPFKLAAFWLMAHGKHMLGVTIFIVAKLIGTALLARIFSLTKPALMTVHWFARAFAWVIGWKLRVYAYVKALPAVVRARRALRYVRQLLKRKWRLMKRRWQRWHAA